ncbi:hypothetical protein [Streptomyces sp. NBC_01483]|uniref:hypothetical protein n=1 Tax=Streptomyces sp. NBC_01483 TaxID=2903883 RepID=UPI002E303DFB|nr:hypothetical protein [Streptomyces sp. NBC_01483]
MADHIRNAVQALIPGDGMRRPSASQLHEADVHASLAKAVNLGRIADALEALAANTVPAATIRAAIHHSA